MNNSITYVNSKRSCLLIALSLLWCFELHAAPPAPLPNVVPQGAKVAAGVANVSSGGTRSAPVLNVNQSSQRAVVDWNTFNVGKDATVNFNQPNANASTLNRISDPNPSAIHGKINAPGEVVLVNPAGVYIGKNASLDVGAVVATTHNVKNDDYMAGSPKYERNGASGKVVNRGTIQTSLKGYVALLAPEVRNDGVIVARMGTVVMASGERIVLNFDSSSKLTSITTTPSNIATLIQNKSAVEAPGGLIILSARATNQLVGGVIKQGGTLVVDESASLPIASASADGSGAGRGGRIILEGDRITLESASKTRANGASGGGSVSIAATNTVNVDANAKISASATQSGQGGNVTITAGESITVASGATIKTHGVDGGGTVNIGTAGVSYQQLENGARTNVVAQNPTKVVTIHEGVTIDASATVRGNGGEINIWSTKLTTVSGTLIARAGPLGGDGGYVETSSAGQLDFGRAILVDVSARNGRTGHWLLDPEDMVITSSTASAISNALSTANVTIAVVGNLSVAADATIAALPNTSSTLTLNATGTITNSGTVSASVLALNSAAINLAAGSTTSSSQVSISAPTVSVSGTVNSYGGSIAVTGGAVIVAGTVSASAGGTSGTVSVSGSATTTTGTSSTTTSGTSGSTSSGSTSGGSTSGGTTGGSSGTTSSGSGGSAGTNANRKTASGTRTRSRDPNTPDSATTTTNQSAAGQAVPLPSVGPSIGLPSSVQPQIATPAASIATGVGPALSAPAILPSGPLVMSVYAGETRALNRAIGIATTSANSSRTTSTINVIARAPPDARGPPDSGANTIAVLTISSTAAATTAPLPAASSPAGAGGAITLDATQSVTMTAGSVISANGNNGPGGAVNVRASNIQIQGVVSANGTTGGVVRLVAPDDHGVISIQSAQVQTNGSSGRGGTVAISGKQQTAISKSTISATGLTQGGRILIGNDAPGGTLPFSAKTTLDAATRLNANQNALDSTEGGFVETSGGTLTLLSSINAGRGGMWLIDPYDITIDSTTAANIVTGLNTQNVTIQTTSTTTSCTVTCTNGSGSGNINVNAPVNATGTYGLTLNAYGTIFLNADITTGGSQTYLGAVRLQRDTVLTANNNSNISFNSYVDSATGSAHSLTTTNGSGATVFGAGIGTRDALSSLSVAGTGDTTVYGNVITRGSAGQSFGGNLYFTSDATMSTSNGAVVVGGKVMLLSTLLQLTGDGGYTFSAGGLIDSGVLSGSSTTLRYGAGSLRYSGGQHYWTSFNGSSLNFLAVGGGGATYYGGTGGGGGGGVMEGAFTAVAGAEYTITVGAGGFGAQTLYAGASGGSSSISGSGLITVVAVGGMGGSTSGTGGASGQGLAGGVESTTGYATGGGAGAGTAGGNGSGNRGGAGGDGYGSSITGSLVYYGAGGGGLGSGTGNSSEGGLGGGGNGAWFAGVWNSTNATGIGGGGGANYNTGVIGSTGDGGTGIVIFAKTSAGNLTINSGTGQVSISGGINSSTLSRSAFSGVSISSQHASSSVAGDVSGATSVSYAGTAIGALTLSGNNSYTAGTSITSGTLRVGSASALGSSSGGVTVADGAVLDLRGVSMTNTNPLNIKGTGISNSGALINSSATAGAYAGAITLSGDTFIAGGSGIIELNSGTPISGAHALTLGGDQGGQVSSDIGGMVTTLTKSGAGTWTLSGAGFYSGATTISAGILKLGAMGAIPDSSSVTVTGTLDLNGKAETIAGISGTGRITSSAAGNPVLTIGGNNASTSFSGQIENGIATSVGITKIGSGVLTLSGTNTFTGPVIVNGGGLTLANGLGIHDSVAVTLSASGVALTLSGSETIGSLSAVAGTTVALGSNTLTLGSSDSTAIAGVISGSGGSVDKVGSGTLTLSGTNTYSGATVVTAGTLKLSNVNVLSTDSALTIHGTLDLNGYSHTIASIAGTGVVSSSGLGSLTITVGGNNASTVFSGVIQNGVASGLEVIKVGSGELTLSGTNTFTGSVNVNAGSLRLSNGQALANSVSVSLTATGSDLKLTDSEVIGSLSAVSGSTITLGSNRLTVGDATSTTVGGVISGTGGGLTKVGSGVLTLSGNNTYTGTTTISEGTIRLGGAGNGAETPLGTTASGTVVAAGASLDLNGYSLSASEALALSGDGASANIGALTNGSTTAATYSGLINLTGSARIHGAGGDIVLSNVGTITGDGYTLTLDGSGSASSLVSPIGTGAGALNKTGTGTWTLSGANIYSGGTTITAGTLQVGNGANSGAVGSGAVVNNGTLKFSRNDTFEVSNVISGTGSVIQSGAGTVVFASNNSYGNTSVVAGILQVGNGGTVGSLGSGAVTNNGILSFKRSDVITVSNLISGTGDIRQIGSGTLTLTNSNTFTGATEISSGVLALNGSGGIQSSSGLINAASFDVTGVTSDASVRTISASVGSSILLGAKNLTITNSSGVIDGVISGVGGSLTLSTGTLTLTGTNTFTGSTTLNDGTLTVTADANLGAAPGAPVSNHLVLNGGTLRSAASFSLSSNREIGLGASGGTISVDAGLELVVGGIVRGATLTKAGSGQLTLGGENTFSGGSTLSAGVLAVSSPTNLGANGITFNGGTLSILNGSSFVFAYDIALSASGTVSNANTTGVTFSGNVNAASTGRKSLTITGAGNTQFQSGSISNGSGTLSLLKSGAGTLTLSGTNTFSGGTTLSAGILTLDSGATLPSGGDVSISNGTLNLGASNSTVGYFSVSNGTVTGTGILAGDAFADVSSGTSVISVNVGAFNRFSKLGSGTLTLSGNNSYANYYYIGSGTLALGSAYALGKQWQAGVAYTTADTQVFYGGKIYVVTADGLSTNAPTNTSGSSSAADTGAVFTWLSSGATISLSGSTLKAYDATDYSNRFTSNTCTCTIDTNGQDITWASSFNSFGLVKVGLGTLTLAGANNVTSFGSPSLQLNGGTLSLGSAGALGSSPSIRFGGGTLRYSVVNTTDYSAFFTQSANQSFKIDTNGQDVSFATGLVSDGGSLSKLGAGRLTLSAANAYTGVTNISGGTLALDGSGAIATSSYVVADGILDVSGTTGSSVVSLSSTGAGVGAVNLGSQTLTITNGAHTFYGVIADGGISGGTSGGVVLGGGRQEFAGVNTYSGSTQINGGTLVITSENNLGAVPSAVTNNALTLNGGTVLLEGSSNTVSLNVNRGIVVGASGGGVAATSGNTLTIAGVVSGASSPLFAVNSEGQSGVVKLSGLNTYAGPTTVSGGTLTVVGVGTLGNSNSLLTLSNSTLALENADAYVGSLLMSGAASRITSTGSTSLTVSGVSTVANSVVTTGIQSFGSAVTLGANVSLTSGSDVTFFGIINGGFELSVNAGGVTRFTNAVGATTELSSVSLVGAAAISAPSVKTVGAQTYSSALTLGADTTLTSTSSGAISFGSTVDGAFSLATSSGGATTFGGVVGMTTALTSLSISGVSVINAVSIRSTGDQTYTGAVTLGADTSLTSTSSGNLLFSSTVSGAYSLTTSTGGNTTFSGTVGGTPLTGLTINTAQLTAGAIALATSGTPALSITNSSTGSITGIISGTNATLTKAGAGTLTLSGANTYGGATTVNNGVLSISSDTNLGSMPGSVVIASVVLDGGALQATENLTLHSNRGVLLGAAGGGLAATTGVELKYAGSIGGAYTLTINGGGQSGQVTLSGSNAYSATVIATGTLQIGDGDVSGTLGTAAVTNNGTLVFKRTDAIAVTQMISGTGAVNLIGTDSGSLILSSGANTYSGNTRIISGVLLAGASTTGSIASGPFGTGSVTVSDGATLDLNGQTIANPLNLNGTGISSLGALINTNVNVGTQTGNVVLQSLTSLGVGAEKSLALNTGVVSGNFALKINAGVGQTGMVLLSGSNTFNAGMTVYAGTVELGASSVGATSSGPLGVSTVNMENGATLNLAGYSLSNDLNLKGFGKDNLGVLVNGNPLSSSTVVGPVALGSSSAIGGSGTLIFNRAVDTNGYGLVFEGIGSFELTNASNRIGTIASNSSINSLQLTSAIDVAIGSVGARSGLEAQSALTILSSGGISINQNVELTSNGDISLRSLGALLIAAGKSVVTTQGNITVVTGKISNQGGSNALVVGGAEKVWQIWSTNSDPFNADQTIGDVTGGLVNNYKQYNATYGTTAALGSGNGFLYTLAPTITVSLVGPISKAYDGTPVANLLASNYQLSGAILEDAVTLNNPTIGAYTTAGIAEVGATAKDVGTAKAVTVTGLSVTSSSNGSVQVYGYAPTASTVTATLGEITPATVKIVGAKTYDGTTSLASSQVTLTGVTVDGVTETLTYSGSPVSSNQNVITSGKYVSGIAALANAIDGSGGKASNYILPSQTVASLNNTVVISAATASLNAEKVYDGSLGLTSAQLRITGVTVDGVQETLGYVGMPVVSDANVATANKYVRGLTGLLDATDSSGGFASNYALPTQTSAGTNNQASISRATLTLTGTRRYDGTTSFAGTNLIAEGVNGESFALTGLGDASNLLSKNVQTNSSLNSVAGLSIGASTGINVGIASNYSDLSAVGSNVSVTRAVAVLSASKTYDGSTSLTSGQIALTGVTVGGVTETLSYTGTPLLSDANVISTKYVRGVTNVSDATDGSGGLASNYVLPDLTSASASNVATVLPATATVSATKMYDGTLGLNASQLTIVGVTVDGNQQILGYTGTPTLAYKNVVTPENYVNVSTMALANGGLDVTAGVASNYTLPANTYSASRNYAVVTKAPITISAAKMYDGNTNMTGFVTILTGVTVSGVTETLSYSGAVASDRNVATPNKYLSSLTINDSTDGSGGRVSNYIVPTLSAATAPVTLTPAPLLATGIKIYDGLLTFPGDRLTVVGLNGDTFTAAGTALMLTKNVQTASPVSNTTDLAFTPVGSAQLSNYSGLSAADVSVTVTALPVTLVAPTVNKVYDGGYTYAMTTSDLSSLSSQLLRGDSVTRAEVIFAGSNPNVGINKTVDLVSATISDGNNGGNYSVALASSSTSTITRAPLMVTAVSDAKFVTQTDAQGYANNCGTNTTCQGNYLGVTYSGFVNGENAMTAVDTLGTVVRSNSTQNSVGTYAGVLVPTGYRASNYVVAFANGDYTILDVQQLLVRVIPGSTTYGNAPTYDASNVKAQYLAADRTTIVDLVPQFAGGRATISDGSTSSASLGFTPALPQYSTSGNLVVGGYNLVPVSPTTTGPNFTTLTLVGQRDVRPKPIAAADVGIVGVSKVYDGNSSVNDLLLTLALETGRVLSGDVLTAKGSGVFDTANIGTSKALNLTVSIAGADAQNYVLSDTSLVSGVNSTAGGAITQRPVVGWRGSASGGLWSDPSNWADGAVPTGSNVGQVVITDGMNVIYDTASVGVVTSTIENRGAISFNNSSNFTLTNNISGTGTLVLGGTGTITLAGDNSFTGGVNLNAASVVLGSATALGTGPLTSNGGTLSVSPGITLNALTVVGPVTLASDLVTAGAQSYTGAVTLSAGSAVGGVVTPMQISSNNADIAFNGTLLGSANSLANKQSVSIGAGTGVVSFTGQIGATRGTYGDFLARVSDQSFYRLNVTASTISASGDIATFDSQTFNGALQIGGSGSNGTARTFLSVDPTITINGRIDDTVANTHSLQLIAVSLTGAESQSIVLNGAVGSVRPLAGLTLTTGIQDPTLTAMLGSVAANPATYSGTIRINESVTTGGNQTYTSNAVQLGNGTPGETITFQTTNGGQITFNLGLTANGGGVTAVSGSTGLSAAFTPSIDYVNPAFLTALTAAGIPYTVRSAGAGGFGSSASVSVAGSGMVNTSTTQATTASVVGWLNQLLAGSALVNVRTPIKRSPDVGTIFGLHEVNEVGQATKQSASLTVAQKKEPYQPPCVDVSVGEDISVCTAD